MTRLGSFYHALVVLVTGLGCYAVTLYIGAVSDDVVSLRGRSLELQRHIDLLNTELASLSRFERIQALSDSTLQLQPLQASQLVTSVNDLVSRAGDGSEVAIRPRTPAQTELVAYRATKPVAPQAGLQRILHSEPEAAPLPLAPEPAVEVDTAGLGASLIRTVETAAAAEARRRP